MKVLSSHAVTKEDLNEVDIRQSRQINQLRVLAIGSFVVNLLVSVGVYFVTR